MPSSAPPSPNSVSSADTTLFTPALLSTARAPTPREIMPEDSPRSETSNGDKETKFASSLYDPPSTKLHSHVSVPSISIHQHHHHHHDHSQHDPLDISPTPTPRRGSIHRAAAPPPILLRRPTEIASSPQVTTPTSSSSNILHPTNKTMRSGSSGLNITGLPEMNGNIELEQESGDAVGDLMASPNRLAFSPGRRGQGVMDTPASPAWQGMDVPPSASTSSWGRRESLEVPGSGLIPSPLGPTSTGRFEPTPHHGIHSRNLSLFFPQPGAASRGAAPGSPMPLETPGDSVIPLPGGRKGFDGGDWTFGSHGTAGGALSLNETPDGVKRGKRRGHHHKHSLSHNFFSFLDPTQTNPSLAPPSPYPSSPLPNATPTPVPTSNLSVGTSNPLIPSSPTLSPLPPSKESLPRQRLLTSFAVMEFMIGCGLWVEGQMSGWRCLAGLGYLVVFDALGVGVGILGGKADGWRSFRRPYGVSRLNSLLYFAQSLFLVFAAVYIAKESIEQVLLGSGAHDHGGHEHGGGGGHSHHGVGEDGESNERPFPHFLLVCAAFASIFSGGMLGNHGKLVDAVGTLFLPASYLSMSLVLRFPALLANPFSLTVAGASVAILVGSMMVPPASLHSLDSSLSLLLTLFTSALSYPPTITLAHVLLQTAPSPRQQQMLNLKKAIRDVKDDKRVLGVGTVRCWMVSAGQGGGTNSTDSGSEIRSRTVSGSGIESRRNSSTGQSNNSISGEITKAFSSVFSPSSPIQSEFSGNINPSTYPSAYINTSTTPVGRSLRRLPSISSLVKSNPEIVEGEVTLVVTLVIHVHPDTSDRDILEITKMIWVKIDNAVNGFMSGMKGRIRGRGRADGGRGDGEVIVSVKRGWEGLEEI